MTGELGGRRVMVQLRRPLADNSLWDVSRSDSSVVVVHRPPPESAAVGHFYVVKLRAPGDTIYSHRFRVSPVAVPQQAYRRALMAQVPAEPLSNLASHREVEQMVIDGVPAPRFQPPISAMVAGLDGTLWLRREGLGTESVSWVMLDRSGRMVATFPAPTGLRILQARRGIVWGVVEDEFDVPYVVRYRLTATDRTR